MGSGYMQVRSHSCFRTLYIRMQPSGRKPEGCNGLAQWDMIASSPGRKIPKQRDLSGIIPLALRKHRDTCIAMHHAGLCVHVQGCAVSCKGVRNRIGDTGAGFLAVEDIGFGCAVKIHIVRVESIVRRVGIRAQYAFLHQAKRPRRNKKIVLF